MSYQRLSETPRKGITEQEKRLEKLLSQANIRYARNQVYCFVCRSHFTNTSPYSYPSMCVNCGTVY